MSSSQVAHGIINGGKDTGKQAFVSRAGPR